MMSKGYKRVDIYLEPELHRAVLRKSIESGQTFSEIVNDAVLSTLEEDCEDLAALAERANEEVISPDQLMRRIN